jgi:hypothetical protein
VGVQKKAWQWTESSETSAEKIDRIVKTKKHREEQYREILKQIQENPTKTKKYKGNKIQGNQRKTKTKSRTINQRRFGHYLAGTPLRKVVMGHVVGSIYYRKMLGTLLIFSLYLPRLRY